MPTSKEYRQQARECLELAHRPSELYIKAALLELVTEFNDAAEELERREQIPLTEPGFLHTDALCDDVACSPLRPTSPA
jgi:hypothetical protein